MLDLISLLVAGNTRSYLLRGLGVVVIFAAVLGIVTCTEKLEEKFFPEKTEEGQWAESA